MALSALTARFPGPAFEDNAKSCVRLATSTPTEPRSKLYAPAAQVIAPTLSKRSRRRLHAASRWSRRTRPILSYLWQRQWVGFWQRFSFRLGQERHGDQPENVEQADDRCRFAIAAQADNQGAGDQRCDRGDQSRCIEDETGSSRSHPRRKEFRQPYRRPRKNTLDEKSIHRKDEQQQMDLMYPQIDDRGEDQAHQVVQERRRLAAERIGKEAEAEEAEQCADILD